MIVLQLLLYCLLFTAMVKIAVIGGAVNGLSFYKASDDRLDSEALLAIKRQVIDKMKLFGKLVNGNSQK